MDKPALPAAFNDLERWCQWSLATEQARSDMRQTSTMADIQAFYDDLLKRTAAILVYVEQFPLDKMPEDAQDYLFDWAKILKIALPEKYLYGEAPRSPKQQGWWNEKEPYQ